MLQKLFYVAYVTNKCLFSFSLPGFMSLCYNTCFEKKIQLLFGQSYMFGDVIIWYGQWQKMIEHASLFIFDLAIRHILFVLV